MIPADKSTSLRSRINGKTTHTHTFTCSRSRLRIWSREPGSAVPSHISLSKWRTINSWVHKIRLHGRRGKGTAESFSGGKLRQTSQKEGEEILCDLLLCNRGWCVHKSDVQKKWNDSTHTQTQTHTHARPGREEDTARLGQADASRLGGRHAGRTDLIPSR